MNTPRWMLSHSTKNFSDDMKEGFSGDATRTITLENGRTFTLSVKPGFEVEVSTVSPIGTVITNKESAIIKPFTIDNVFAFANHVVEGYTKPEPKKRVLSKAEIAELAKRVKLVQ